MITSSHFTSVIGPAIASYLELMRALGRQYKTEERVLAHLDAFLTADGGDLTPDCFNGWCRTREHTSTGVRRSWMRIVRNFCLYRQRTQDHCFVPDKTQFPPCHQPIRPYIFRTGEISCLLKVTESLVSPSRSPLFRENARLALVLLYTAGLRRGELMRLTIGDYTESEQTLLIQDSKFKKSRLLPLSLDAGRALTAYLALRKQCGYPVHHDAALLYNRTGKTNDYTGTGIRYMILGLLKTAKIKTPFGRYPRVHDFRHTFAVHALQRWYRTGAEVQSKLPYLAAYMGHVSIVSTEHYLQFVEDLAELAGKRFEQHYGSLIVPVPSQGIEP